MALTSSLLDTMRETTIEDEPDNDPVDQDLRLGQKESELLVHDRLGFACVHVVPFR